VDRRGVKRMPEKQESTTLFDLDSEVVMRIQRLLRQSGIGGRVEAIKLYMHETGVGLRDAKSALDKEMEFLEIPIQIRRRI
jgi:ribosomal protein L7/L12